MRLSYLKIRDVTTKDEEANGASTYVAVLPAAEILKIGTDGNLRSYIPAHEGKKRNLVHKAIARTIRDDFIVSRSLTLASSSALRRSQSTTTKKSSR